MRSKSLFFIMLFTVIIFSACGEPDPRSKLFSEDSDQLGGVSLDGGRDTLEESLANFFNIAVNPELEPTSNSYHIRISDDGKRVLILIQMPKLKKVKKESRDEVVGYVQTWQMITPSVQGLDLYLGVKGRVTWMVTKAPGKDTESKLLGLTSDLYDFYGPLSDFESEKAE